MCGFCSRLEAGGPPAKKRKKETRKRSFERRANSAPLADEALSVFYLFCCCLLAAADVLACVDAWLRTGKVMPEVLLAPAYLAPQATFSDVLALLAITGLANRAAPQVWLNASSESWIEGVPVMWPFPQADPIWWNYLQEMKNVTFDVAPNAELCSILSDPRVESHVKGIIVYVEACTWLSVGSLLPSTVK